MIVFYRDPQRLSYPYSNNDLCQVSLWHEFVFLYLTIAVREVPSCRLSSIPPSLRPLSGQREISPNPAGYCSSLGACAATLWSNANAKVIRNQSQIVLHQQRCPFRISTATLIHRRTNNRSNSCNEHCCLRKRRRCYTIGYCHHG